jgi:hypothetical protein
MKGVKIMATPRVLIRCNSAGEMSIYVYTMPAPKGYIKRWTGTGKSFVDASLASYKATAQASGSAAVALFNRFKFETGLSNAVRVDRLQRGYQSDLGAGDYVLKATGGVFRIEDATGVLIQAYMDEKQAIAALKRLSRGQG